MKRVRPSQLSLCLLLCFTAMTAGALAAPSAYETLVLGDNPFLYYRLGETTGSTAGDSGGNLLDGSYEFAPTLGVAGAGMASDNAVLLDASQSEHVITPAGANTFGSLMGNSTFEFVFSTTETPEDATTALLGSANTGSTTNVGIGFNERADGSARMFVRDENGSPIGGFFIDENMFDGQFHHLMFTYDSAGVGASDRMKAYLDGVEKTLTFEDSSAPSNFTSFQNPLTIGANNNRGTIDRFLNGVIDEVAIYNTTLSATDAFNRFNALGIVVPNQWNVNGGGSFNTAANWLDDVVPTDNALFGNVLASGDATVTVDSAVSLNSLTFNNENQYTLAGPSAVTLTGDAEISTVGTHQINADLAGASGLTKVGGGQLNLSGSKSYTGVTDVQAGTLSIDSLDAIDNQTSSALNIEPGATAVLNGTTGTLAAQLTGASTATDATLTIVGAEPTDTLTISRSNASFGGVIRVNGGTLAVANNNALGTGGVSDNRTVVQAGSTAKIALPGGVIVTNEALDFEGRNTDDPALTSAGNNAWNGVVRGEGNSDLSNFNIESTSGTLTLSQLFAEDSAEQFNFVFSGAGNTTVTSRISDADIDIDTGIVTVKTNDNVGVVKRGSGNLTIGYATTLENDYWFGPTVIEEGTMIVSASGGTDGELRSSSITVQENGTLNIAAFTEYTQQIGQAIRGSGTINVGAGNLRLIDVSEVAPGESPGAIGELKVSSGTVTLPNLALGGGGVWKFDIGNNTDTSGDLLNVQNGSFTATTSGITINVTPAHGTLDAGERTIVSHTGGTNPALNSVSAQITDAAGNVLSTRQSVGISGATPGQVNVMVTGEEQSRTWNGNLSGAWDYVTSNWQEGDQQFRDLDHVTFNATASGTTDVAVDGSRSPGSVTFAGANNYSLSGDGGIVGSGPVNVTGSGTVTLSTTGNDYSGATTINAGSTLRMTTASTGSITNSGTLSLDAPVTVDNVLVQDGMETIGVGAYNVFAFEAEEFQTLTENATGSTTWTVDNTVAGSSDGEALYATESSSNTATTTGDQNFVTYNMIFTQPGTYEWYSRMVSVDGGDPGTGDDDSFYAPTDDMDSGNTDPTSVGSRIENFGSGVITEEGSIGDPSVYDWTRNGHNNEFSQIVVTDADVAAGTVFKFKVATREGGMTLDKFAFVADADFTTDPNFGTITDLDLDAAASIVTGSTEFAPGGVALDVNGDFTMGSGATLDLRLGSPALHDRLDISGALNADGTLNISGNTGFSAEDGDVFDIFSFASVSGMFDDILLPTLTAGLDWDTSNLLVSGELSVVAVALLPGDANGDGKVDILDLDILSGNFGTMGGATVATGDFNGDGNVDILDLDILSGNFGAMASASASIPEPTTLVVLTGLVACSVLGSRRRS